MFHMRESAQSPLSCPVCRTRNVSFAPLSDIYRDNARRHGYAYFGRGEMTALETYSCMSCGASDRERLYALWIEEEIKKSRVPEQTRLLHFAPEPALSGMLRQMKVFDYKTADLLMGEVDYHVDMMDLPFEAGVFDWFICSHVLEHVEDDDRAIAELYRITKPSGVGILMVPIIVGLEKTIEDLRVTDEAGRWRLYGQGDHVRLYAHDDYVRKIRGHGFAIAEYGEDYFGREVFQTLGLKRTSILYVVAK